MSLLLRIASGRPLSRRPTLIGVLVLALCGLFAALVRLLVFGRHSAGPGPTGPALQATQPPGGSELPAYAEWWAGTSRASRRLSQFSRFGIKPAARRWPFTATDVRGREVFDRLTEHFAGAPLGAEVTPCVQDDFTAEWVRLPGGQRGVRVVLFMHGGGFIFGSSATHRALTARIASLTQGEVLSVDYRFETLRRHGSAADDCLAAYRWLLGQGWASHQIVLCGDSAGGNLAVATSLRIRDLGLPQPAGLVGMSPFLDLSASGDSVEFNARTDTFMSGAFLRNCAAVAAQGCDPADPAVSPVFAEVTGLPPTLLQVSSSELLYSDSARLAARLTAAGVPCVLQVWEKQIHVFQLYDALPEAWAATTEIARFVDRVTSR